MAAVQRTHQEELLVRFLRDVQHITHFSMRAQGNHKTYGTTCVVYLQNYEPVPVPEVFLRWWFLGNTSPGLCAFADAIEEKLVGAYFCGFTIHGRDSSGDSIEFDYKFANQESFLRALRNEVIVESIPPKKESSTWKSRFSTLLPSTRSRSGSELERS
jgi:hypothetical protein